MPEARTGHLSQKSCRNLKSQSDYEQPLQKENGNLEQPGCKSWRCYLIALNGTVCDVSIALAHCACGSGVRGTRKPCRAVQGGGAHGALPAGQWGLGVGLRQEEQLAAVGHRLLPAGGQAGAVAHAQGGAHTALGGQAGDVVVIPLPAGRAQQCALAGDIFCAAVAICRIGC